MPGAERRSRITEPAQTDAFASQVREALRGATFSCLDEAALDDEQLSEWRTVWDEAAKLDDEQGPAGPPDTRSVAAMRMATRMLYGYTTVPLGSYDASLPARVPPAPVALLVAEGSDGEKEARISVAEYVLQVTRPGQMYGYDGSVCELCGAHDVCLLGSSVEQSGATNECGLSGRCYGPGLCRSFASLLHVDQKEPEAPLDVGRLCSDEEGAPSPCVGTLFKDLAKDMAQGMSSEEVSEMAETLRSKIKALGKETIPVHEVQDLFLAMYMGCLR